MSSIVLCSLGNNNANNNDTNNNNEEEETFPIPTIYRYVFLLILLSFDWLADFHLDLLQAIVLIAV
jgi:hypothetical protein